MKYFIILFTLLFISCGSTKQVSKSDSTIDTTSTTKTKIKSDIVITTNIKDTTSVKKKDSTSITNNIITNTSNINIKPKDSKLPITVEDSKGNKYKVINGEINITNETKEDKSKTTTTSDLVINTGHTDNTKTNSKINGVTKKEIKGKSNINTKEKFKRNWTLFPLFLLILLILGIKFRPYVLTVWTVIKKFILPI